MNRRARLLVAELVDEQTPVTFNRILKTRDLKRRLPRARRPSSRHPPPDTLNSPNPIPAR